MYILLHIRLEEDNAHLYCGSGYVKGASHVLSPSSASAHPVIDLLVHRVGVSSVDLLLFQPPLPTDILARTGSARQRSDKLIVNGSIAMHIIAGGCRMPAPRSTLVSP